MQLQVRPPFVTVLVPVQFAVIPVGKLSLTVIVPDVEIGPELVTVKVY